MMRRVPLRVVDGLRYIEYELNVDALRKKRKARLALVKMSLSDTAGAKRVHAIFDRLLYKHRGNVDLWLQYISFCKTEGSTRVLSHVFTRALQSHPRSSELWIEAASFEFSENLSVDSARVLMQRAIRINRQDPKLWLEYFRLELLYIQKLSVRREVLRLDGEDAETRTPTEDASVLLEELPEETETGTTDGQTTEEIAAATEKQRTRAMVLDGAIPRIIFQNAVKAIPNDMAFRLQFVAIADLFGRRFAANLSQFILDACATDFPMSELVHATKALRPFLTAETVDEAEREAVALFEQSVATLPTVTMKEKFVEWLVDRLASPDKTPYLFAYATKTIKQYVDDQEVVSVEICTTYIDFVARTEGSAAAVRAAHEILALKRYEACAALWLLYSQLVLHPHSHDDDHEKRATKRRRSTEAKSSTHHHKKQPLEESAGILRDALKHVDGEDADGRFAVWTRLLELLVADAHSTPSAIDAAFQVSFVSHSTYSIITKGLTCIH
jgi:U3 small nucleolar RNA-associated protein 6